MKRLLLNNSLIADFLQAIIFKKLNYFSLNRIFAYIIVNRLFDINICKDWPKFCRSRLVRKQKVHQKNSCKNTEKSATFCK